MPGIPPGVGQFLKGQIFEKVPVPNTDLDGRTFIVTGANSGLGLECCKHLARQGAAHIIMGCRNIEAANTAKTSIEAAAKSQGSLKVTIWPIDLANYSSITEFADKCKELDRIDGLVANAGIHPFEFKLIDEDESTIRVNVFGTFFLILLMIPVMHPSAAKYGITPHISITGSAVAFFADQTFLAKIPEGQIFSTLSDEKSIKWSDQYNQSKLVVLLCVQELAHQISESKQKDHQSLILNNIAPGYCKTNLFRDGQSAALSLSLMLIGRSGEAGGRTLAHGVTAGSASHGKYLSECQVKPAPPFVTSADGVRVQKAIWNELMAKLQVVRPGIESYLN